jgi:hypothetical protein
LRNLVASESEFESATVWGNAAEVAVVVVVADDDADDDVDAGRGRPGLIGVGGRDGPL